MTASEFKNLFLSLNGHLYRVAFGILKNEDDAQDVVQDVYVKLWQQRNRIDFNKISPRPYITSMVRNACFDRFRASQLTIDPTPAEQQYRLPDSADLVRDVENRDSATILRKLIAALPPTQRDIISMRDIDGLDFEEISQITHLREGNIRVILSRTRSLLRSKMQQIHNFGYNDNKSN